MKLALKNISKSFDNRLILDDISFEVQAGEFVSLIGPSGSGKSTMFNLIGGLLSPDHGEILMNDELITNKSGHISYMPQQSSLFPWRTILNNVLLGQEIQGLRETERAIEIGRASWRERVEQPGAAVIVRTRDKEERAHIRREH